MNKSNMNIAKGMGTGLMAGMIVGYVGARMAKPQNKSKNKISQAMYSIGDMLDKNGDFFG